VSIWNFRVLISWRLACCLEVVEHLLAIFPNMLFTTIAATLLSLASWTPQATAKLAITADHHSWGGVNYPMLQFFTREHRDNTIRALVDAKVRVVRLFSTSPSDWLPIKQLILS
jgi:hypothetical protein